MIIYTFVFLLVDVKTAFVEIRCLYYGKNRVNARTVADFGK